jgi:hypothetical protein
MLGFVVIKLKVQSTKDNWQNWHIQRVSKWHGLKVKI